MSVVRRCMTCGQAFREGDPAMAVTLEVRHPAYLGEGADVAVNGVMHKTCVSDLLQTVLTPWSSYRLPTIAEQAAATDEPAPVPEPGRPSI